MAAVNKILFIPCAGLAARLAKDSVISAMESHQRPKSGGS